MFKPKRLDNNLTLQELQCLYPSSFSVNLIIELLGALSLSSGPSSTVSYSHSEQPSTLTTQCEQSLSKIIFFNGHHYSPAPFNIAKLSVSRCLNPLPWTKWSFYDPRLQCPRDIHTWLGLHMKLSLFQSMRCDFGSRDPLGLIGFAGHTKLKRFSYFFLC